MLGNERDNEQVARILGGKRTFNLNYSNHRRGDISLNEPISRLILVIRVVKADTVVCWALGARRRESGSSYDRPRGGSGMLDGRTGTRLP